MGVTQNGVKNVIRRGGGTEDLCKTFDISPEELTTIIRNTFRRKSERHSIISQINANDRKLGYQPQKIAEAMAQAVNELQQDVSQPKLQAEVENSNSGKQLSVLIEMQGKDGVSSQFDYVAYIEEDDEIPADLETATMEELADYEENLSVKVAHLEFKNVEARGKYTKACKKQHDISIRLQEIKKQFGILLKEFEQTEADLDYYARSSNRLIAERREKKDELTRVREIIARRKKVQINVTQTGEIQCETELCYTGTEEVLEKIVKNSSLSLLDELKFSQVKLIAMLIAAKNNLENPIEVKFEVPDISEAFCEAESFFNSAA